MDRLHRAWTRLSVAVSLTVALACVGTVHAVPGGDNILLAMQSTKRVPTAQRAAAQPPARPADVVVATGTAVGQAGYIHYFIITGPDGEPESHVGLELPGDRIVWSFPGLGVTIVPFMKTGTVNVEGKTWEIEHLYGLRPLRDDAALRSLQRNIADRTAWWIDEKIAYCDEERPSARLCVSCLGFVLRVLYPGSSPMLPALPGDFRSVRRNVYTTEDLLLYLAGVRIDVPREARLKHVAGLDVPDILREELVRLASAEGIETTSANAEAKPSVTRPRGRSVASPRRAAAKSGS